MKEFIFPQKYSLLILKLSASILSLSLNFTYRCTPPSHGGVSPHKFPLTFQLHNHSNNSPLDVNLIAGNKILSYTDQNMKINIYTPNSYDLHF